MVEVKNKQSVKNVKDKSTNKSKDTDYYTYMRECICSVCGKKFMPAVNHIYKNKPPRDGIKQCSYSCWCKAGNNVGYL